MRSRKCGLVESSLFITSDLPAAFFTRFLVMLPGPEDLEDSLALNLFLEPPQGFLKRFIFSHQDFRHKEVLYAFLL